LTPMVQPETVRNWMTGIRSRGRPGVSPGPEAAVGLRCCPRRLHFVSTARLLVALGLTWAREVSVVLPSWMKDLVSVEPCILFRQFFAGSREEGEDTVGG